MKKLTLKTPVTHLYMVGKNYARRLEKLDIQTVEDLLHHYPFRYDDFSLVSPILKAQPGETVTIKGKVVDCQNIYTKRGKQIQKALISDNTGEIKAVWFNQPYLTKTLKKGSQLSLAGEVKRFQGELSLSSPEYELINKRRATIHTGRLVPIYPETRGVSSKWLRSRIWPLITKVLPRTDDWLPAKVKQKHQLIDLQSALRQIHFPENRKEISEARQRLAFDELFLIQLQAQARKKAWQKNQPVQHLNIDQTKVSQFIQKLPFELTEAQKKAVRKILEDLGKDQPMNRLLQGDVGSGKTVVAAIAAYAVYLNGFKTAFMAPTEILAQQHYQTLTERFKSLGLKTALLTSSQKSSRAEQKAADLIIGTHALIHNQANWAKLGLVVIDEQHRFGVEQRGKLIKKGRAPHVLTMTATPIPRTISLTFYGDLDLVVLDEMPPGRKKTKTWVVPVAKRPEAYQWIKKQVKKHQSQAFIVCPLIEESEAESMKEIKAAGAEFDRLSQKVFPELKLGLLHGRTKSKQKDRIINQFKKGDLDILVSTPVVEVGIDIPKATIMVIEGAERFGLAQLHQLRGRVGRSDKQSYCLLFAAKKAGKALKRLSALKKYQSGFKLAEIDLKLRGPGEIYGTKQHGFPETKIASLTDRQLIEKTKRAAEKIFDQLQALPGLKTKLENYTIREIKPN